MFNKFILTATVISLGLALGACGNKSADKNSETQTSTDTQNSKEAKAPKAKQVFKFDGAKLDATLNAQSDEAKARYKYRNPRQTLEFLGIAPGMSVGEALPGGGYYTKILMPYIGSGTNIYGIDYSLPMWGEFSFANEEFLKSKETWPKTWTEQAREWRVGEGPLIGAFTFESPTDQALGSLDAVLFIRAMHNLSRFDKKGDYMQQALITSHNLLKEDGILGIVQHRAPEGAEAEWADGRNGYLKQSDVIATVEAQGFKFVGSSEVNANPNDKPGAEDSVWRLPPSLASSRDNEELREQMKVIGESDRMTLKFVKVK